MFLFQPFTPKKSDFSPCYLLNWLSSGMDNVQNVLPMLKWSHSLVFSEKDNIPQTRWTTLLLRKENYQARNNL